MTQLRSILIGTLLALGGAFAQQASITVQAATWQLGATLATGIDAMPTPDVVLAFGDLRTSAEASGDARLMGLVQPIQDVEAVLVAEPFEAPALVSALETLALELRRAAEEGGPLLLTELASLVDQASHLVEGGDFVPRMDVEME